ncbi:MAG: hypothetical protein EOO40_04230 [Deltaproteobacteria bacterium]|nr:MAG: hypothetical protein EOO40_04230 [Deltaproteobacteria bacterium]
MVQPQTYHACRNAAHGKAATNECGAPVNYELTSPGLTLSEAKRVSHERIRPDTIFTCLTCDDVPWETLDQTRQKLRCLTNLPPQLQGNRRVEAAQERFERMQMLIAVTEPAFLKTSEIREAFDQLFGSIPSDAMPSDAAKWLRKEILRRL